MIEIEGEIQPIVIKGNKEDAENSGGYYAEAPWMFKRDSTYYFVYSNGWRSQSTIIYAIGNNPMGPFNYLGEVMSPVGAGTSHASILQYNDKWYIFYHNNVLSDNGKRRSICYDEITFDIDGKINHLIYNER